MARLFILLTTVFLLTLFVRELRKYFARDQKEQELNDTFIEGELVDIDLEIAEEKVRQNDIRAETNDLNSKNNINKEEHHND